MIDQATELRKLVLRAMRQQPVSAAPPPRQLVVTGGNRGAGVTTVAVNLSVALAEQGLRVVIVEANMQHSEVAALCGLHGVSLSTSLTEASRDIHQVLHRGPAGIQILPGLRQQVSNGTDQSELAAKQRDPGEFSYVRLQRQLVALGRHADIVVLDVGSENSELIQRFSSTADDVLLVTTPDDIAVMDTYARIKADLAPVAKAALRLVVNRASDASQAVDVHRRIDASSRKFLDAAIAFAGHIPQDDAVSRGVTHSVPCVHGEPTSAAALAVGKIASALVPALCQVRSA